MGSMSELSRSAKRRRMLEFLTVTSVCQGSWFGSWPELFSGSAEG